MRTLFTTRHLSADTPPAGEPSAVVEDANSDSAVVEDANSDSGTPSLLFLGLIIMGVMLLFWLLAPRVELRGPVGEYQPAKDPAVDLYGVVDAAAGVYRVPVETVASKVAGDPSLLAPIAPAGGFVEVDTSTPEGQGQALFAALTCNACHSINGTPMVGPTLQAVMGRAGELADGAKFTVDDAYLSESIKEPMAKIAAGYPPAMVLPRQPNDEEVAQLVAYLKTL